MARESKRKRAAGRRGGAGRRTSARRPILVASPAQAPPAPAAGAGGPGDVAAAASAGAAGTTAAYGDVILAKQAVSLRLLRAGLTGAVLARRPAVSLASAVALASQSIHAVGVGRKVVAGQVTDQRAVRVYVLQKLAPSAIAPKDRVPSTIDGVPTDVIESAPAFITAAAAGAARAGAATTPVRRRTARPSARRLVTPSWPAEASVAEATPCSDQRRGRQRPLIAGISAAHRGVTAGTIGYFCRSTRHGDSPDALFILSNNHVLAHVNAAQPGDDVYQPGPADGGTVTDHVAELHRFAPIVLGGTTPNRIDAAIARLLPGTEVFPEVCGIGPVNGAASGREQMAVRKHGRTTGLTAGMIVDESYDALVGMDHLDPSIVALFENQMRIEVRPPFAAIGLGGDSGSLVVDDQSGAAVGLYFAGPPSGDYGIANQIEDVIRLLEIELV